MIPITTILIGLTILISTVLFLDYLIGKKEKSKKETKDFLEILFGNYAFPTISIFNFKSTNKELVHLTSSETRFLSKSQYDLLFEAAIETYFKKNKISFKNKKIKKVILALNWDEYFFKQIELSKLNDKEKLFLRYNIVKIAKDLNLIRPDLGDKELGQTPYERYTIIKQLKIWVLQ